MPHRRNSAEKQSGLRGNGGYIMAVMSAKANRRTGKMVGFSLRNGGAGLFSTGLQPKKMACMRKSRMQCWR